MPIEPDGSKRNHVKVAEFFVQRNNEWEQAPRIAEALGLTRGTVATVLWTTHGHMFEQAPVAGSVKKKKWRLRASIYDGMRPVN